MQSVYQIGLEWILGDELPQLGWRCDVARQNGERQALRTVLIRQAFQVNVIPLHRSPTHPGTAQRTLALPLLVRCVSSRSLHYNQNNLIYMEKRTALSDHSASFSTQFEIQALHEASAFIEKFPPNLGRVHRLFQSTIADSNISPKLGIINRSSPIYRAIEILKLFEYVRFVSNRQ